MNDQTTTSYPNVAQSFGITGIVILGMLLFMPVNLLLNKFFGKEASLFIYYLLAFGIPFWIVYSIQKRETSSQTFNLTIENKRIIPLVIVGAIALRFGVISPIVNSMPMSDSIKKAFMEFGSLTGIFSFLVLVIAAPILEELIFRGIILDGLLKKYSPIKSILLSSFLFGLVHLNPWQFVTAIIIGGFAGWVYYRTKSLSLTIIIHAAVNLTGFIMIFFIDVESSMDETLTEMYGGQTNMILIIAGSIIVFAACWYFLKGEFSKEKVQSAA